MSELMRRYWIPCLPSSEFPEPDSPAKELRDHGNVPDSVDDSQLWRVRAGSFKLPADADWRAATSVGRSADSGEAIADEVPLLP